MYLNFKTSHLKWLAISIIFCILFTTLLAAGSFLKQFLPVDYERFAYGVIGTLIAILLTWIFLRIERKTFSMLGLNWGSHTIGNFLIGLLIGIVLSLVMIGILLWVSDLRLVRSPGTGLIAFLGWTLALLPLAYMEELAFRGYPFINLNEKFNPWVAQLLVSIMFAFYHFAGGQSLSSSFIGPGTWSFVFGLAMMMSGGLAVPTGIHYAANIVQAAMGTKNGFPSLWYIDGADKLGPDALQRIEMNGNIIQISLLFFTLILMSWHIRNKKYKIVQPKMVM